MSTFQELRGFTFVLCAVLSGTLGTKVVAQSAEDTPKEIIADQIGQQGYSCVKPISAQRDIKLSKADEAVWILKCKNAAYRVRLVPDMAAMVERVDTEK
jgi:hypothetical protein